MTDVKRAPAKPGSSDPLEERVEDISDGDEAGGVRDISEDVSRQGPRRDGTAEHARRRKQMQERARVKHALHKARHRSRAGGPREPEGPEYGREPGEDAASAVSRQAEAAPVHGNPTLDPVTTVWDVALMAGYGDGAGYETMQGVDDYVLGKKDAMQEARVSSETEGGPLDLEKHESIYSDDAGFGDLTIALREEERVDTMDWRAEERSYGGFCEPEEESMFADGAAFLLGGGN